MRIKVNYKISILYRHSAIASCHFPRLLGKARGYVYVCEKALPRLSGAVNISCPLHVAERGGAPAPGRGLLLDFSQKHFNEDKS